MSGTNGWVLFANSHPRRSLIILLLELILHRIYPQLILYLASYYTKLTWPTWLSGMLDFLVRYGKL